MFFVYVLCTPRYQPVLTVSFPTLRSSDLLPFWPVAWGHRAPVQNGARVTQSIPLHAFVEKLARRRLLSDRDREALFALPHVVKTMRRHDYLVREEEEAKNC